MITDRFRILSVDGGGIRGLIPALVVADLERRICERAGEQARICDYVNLFAGTSTGGLIALALTAPDPADPDRPRVSAAELAAFYVQDGPRIFRRSLQQKLRTAWGYAGPKYSLGPLAESVRRRLGDALPAAAASLIAEREAELDEIADRLLAAGPLEADPHAPP